jgi:hypothetical protein
MRKALALVVWLGSSPTGPRVVVSPDVRCPSASDIEQALRNLPGSATTLPDGSVLRVARAEDLISVSLEDGQHAVRGARNLRTTGSCAEIARTISLLVHAWQEGIAVSAAADAGPAPPVASRVEPLPVQGPAPTDPDAAPAASATSGDTPRGGGTAQATVGHQRQSPVAARQHEHAAVEPTPTATPLESGGRSAPDSPATLAAEAERNAPAERTAASPLDVTDRPDAGATVARGTAPAEAASTDAGEVRPATWSAVALGGVDPTSGQVIATGLLRIERVIGLWGVGAEVHAESPRTRELAPGRVSVWTASLGLVGRRTLFLLGMGALEVAAAVAAELLSASATGFTSNRGVVLPSFTASVSTEWDQPLAWGLSVRAWVRFDVHPWRESLEIDNIGPVLILPAVGGSAGLGAGWTF